MTDLTSNIDVTVWGMGNIRYRMMERAQSSSIIAAIN